MSRRMIRKEGLLCGGSCGSAMVGALRAIKQKGLKKGQRCVVLLADSVRNYMSKFLSDSWMVDNNFMESTSTHHMGQWWSERKVTQLNLQAPVTLKPDVTTKLISGNLTQDTAVSSCLFKGHKTIGIDCTLGRLATIFDTHHYALLCTSQKTYGADGSFTESTMITAVVTRIDLLGFITSGPPGGNS